MKSNGNGWFPVSNLIVDQGLGPFELATYLVLCRHASNGNGKPKTCWPCTRRIAAESGMRRNRVFPALKKLQDLGLISIQGKYRKVNVYTIEPIKTACQSGSPAEPPRGSPVEHHVVHQSNTEQDLTEQDKSLKLEKEREELFLKASKDGRAKSKHPKQQLGLEMDLWNWMRQACLRAGKKWTLLDPGKRGRRNMGPTQSMMEQMRQDEKSEIWGPTNYRGYFLDFLASQESERGGTWYPFQYFMHEYMDKVTSELPHENRLADLMKKRQDLSPWPGAGPGRPREDVESILDAGTAVKRREEVDEALLEINRVGPQRATSGGFIDPATIIVPGKGIQSDDPEVFGSEQ